MNYRLQDLMKLIIPGLYIIASVVGWQLLSSNNHFDTSKIKDVVGIIVLLIPFFGFVVGYLVECIMSAIEHLFYKIGGRRPSKTILCGKLAGLYALNAKEKILAQNHLTGKISNVESNEILQMAKQTIDREKVETFRLNSMLARNIFGSQFILTILYSFVTDIFYLDFFFYILIAVSFLFFLYWVHHTHVYVKYVLSEYGKTLVRCELK